MAGIFRFAQVAIKSSGKDAPSRKLKAERQWSSMYIDKSTLNPDVHGGERKKNASSSVAVLG
jgi:hypothetical protein